MTSEPSPQSGARDRAYALQAVRVPLMRAIGFAFMLVALSIHNALLYGPDSAKIAIPWTLILGGYTAISFLILQAYYRRPGREGRNGVGWIFLLGDAVFIAALVYISGADRSWLFLILLMPVLTHGQFSAKRSILQSAWITTMYAGMLLYAGYVAKDAVDWPLGIAKGLLLALIAGYCVLIAVIAENNRKRIAAALREAKSQAESRAAHLAALNRLTHMAAGVLDLDTMLATVTREMVALFNASSSGIALMDEQHRVLRVAAHYSVHPEQQGLVGTEIPLSGNPTAESVVESGRPLVINHSLLLAPLRSYGEVIGTISIDTDDPNRTFTGEEVELAETIAGEIAGPVGNARLYASLQESNRLLADLSLR
ncbi:MAG TPA: GAF domain-containing protein, partial [Thermoanaerobaculia bacterium]